MNTDIHQLRTIQRKHWVFAMYLLNMVHTLNKLTTYVEINIVLTRKGNCYPETIA